MKVIVCSLAAVLSLASGFSIQAGASPTLSTATAEKQLVKNILSLQLKIEALKERGRELMTERMSSAQTEERTRLLNDLLSSSSRAGSMVLSLPSLKSALGLRRNLSGSLSNFGVGADGRAQYELLIDGGQSRLCPRSDDMPQFLLSFDRAQNIKILSRACLSMQDGE